MNYDRDNPQRESLRMIPRTQMKSQQLIEIEKKTLRLVLVNVLRDGKKVGVMLFARVQPSQPSERAILNCPTIPRIQVIVTKYGLTILQNPLIRFQQYL